VSSARFGWGAAAIALVLLLACDRPVDARPPTVRVPADPWMPARVGDVRGVTLFAPCASCHLSDASGRSDGTVPRLAGQRKAVLEGKLRRLQTGEVKLPVMVPFARALSADETTEIARYLSRLAVLPEPSPGVVAGSTRAGAGVSEAATAGEAEYTALCAACHGGWGEGRDDLRAPRLCGQHAAYLQRRVAESAADLRGDADPAMAAIARELPDAVLGRITGWLAASGCLAEATR